MNALDDGADDYLTKPFHFDELFSRIKALTRRANRLIETTTNLQQFGSLSIDYDQYKVSVNQKEVDLSPTEMKPVSYTHLTLPTTPYV